MNEALPAADDGDDTLLARLSGPQGKLTRDQALDALDQLQAKLLAHEQRGVPPEQAKPLAAALLAVQTARATLDSVRVGAAAENKQANR